MSEVPSDRVIPWGEGELERDTSAVESLREDWARNAVGEESETDEQLAEEYTRLGGGRQ